MWSFANAAIAPRKNRCRRPTGALALGLWGDVRIRRTPNMRVIPCSNHLAKNAGKKAFEVGHRLHLHCKSCPVKLNADGVTPNAKGLRTHRGLNEVSDPQVKAWQRNVGCALCCSCAPCEKAA